MSDNVAVIVLTSCHFLFTGLKQLLSESLIPLRLLQASSVDEVLELQATAGVTMIVVAGESGSPVGYARARAQLWSLERMMMTRALPRVPCLMLVDDMSVTVAGETYWLTPKYLAQDLEMLLGDILVEPERYLDRFGLDLLSAQQRVILDGTLAGLDVEAIAGRMHILPRTVYSHRNMLVKKLGLRNRMELMCLSPRDFRTWIEL
ncbi:helix-turn-helix transcriptional regulator [Salmonella enterica]|nr:helix-turn-helix transcriptional regulator [Salmonella enterica]ECC4608441.1 helix-turn-helix transcriptional regulator [Salmonella enterica]ECJ1396106.1 helix-turn-helix transcriptional regulator [Salmonella enterica]ECR4999307.1 helix-turn-helix transcriptional regulator [Salmonella enterica]ECY1592219.1 helix-turn-helix transcriptional regulator [Salmonella enterica]